ncbi:MAG: hypothetical protein H7A25_04925 [Leptospiraceae bacterium]|nr:hypothetical protein [Leptospiraceae bacterium]MCP5499221.1 hypothetical protein [Leptospiraceae bacterium]
MSEEKSQNFTVSNSGNMTGVNIGSGSQTISGNVSSILNEIKEPEKSDIKTALEELKGSIEKEKELDDTSKTDALEYLKTIAEALKASEANKSTVKMAVNALKGILVALPAAAELAILAQATIPKIMQHFGL